MRGVITKTQRGLYYVDTEIGTIKSKARGLLREKKLNPLVGDRVELRITEEDQEGYIEEILERRNSLIRPQVANVDMALAVFSLIDPPINSYLLDKNLIMTEYLDIQTLIVFTKSDITDNRLMNEWKKKYESIGYRVLSTSMFAQDGDIFMECLNNKTTTVYGPSGAGKTTLINKISPGKNLLTSNVSDKNRRGRHTTRHTELFKIGKNSYIFDTPGFSSLELDFFESEFDIEAAYRDFQKYKHDCRFMNCLHLEEPGCGVKKHLGKEIYKSRYENYILFIEEYRKKRRY